MILCHQFTVSLLLILQLFEADSIPIEEFFPFGSTAGDQVLSLGDDGTSVPLPLNPPYPILGVQRTSLRVCATCLHYIKGYVQPLSLGMCMKACLD
jgi:hypothetical protein